MIQVFDIKDQRSQIINQEVLLTIQGEKLFQVSAVFGTPSRKSVVRMQKPSMES